MLTIHLDFENFKVYAGTLNKEKALRWLDTEFHTPFRTSGSPHKPSRDFSMLA